MRRAVAVARRGTWSQADSVGTITLAFEDRHRRRWRMRDDAGEDFLLDLDQATILDDGDGLCLDGSGVILVRAADEAVADIHAPAPELLASVAWRIGNCHAPMAVIDDVTLRVRDDAVLLAFLELPGVTIEHLTAPFAPTTLGAHGAAGHGSHGTSHETGHAHA